MSTFAKSKQCLVSMSAQCVHAQGVNLLVFVDIYFKGLVPCVLYGSELWYSIPNADMSAISRFKHKAVKRLQGLPVHTRSDMAESMVGLNRLPSKIEYRKLLFLHKIISLPAGSVSRDFFIRKLTFY